MRKKVIFIFIIILVLLITGGIFTYVYLQNRIANDGGNIQKDNFNLTYSYKGNNSWEYTVTGTLPTPCYKVTTDSVVMESYPEQVRISAKVETDSETEVCATVIQDYTYNGTFNASEKATVTLVVE